MYQYIFLLFFLTNPFFGILQSLSQPLFQPTDDILNNEDHHKIQSDPLLVSDRWRFAQIDKNEIIHSSESSSPLVLNLFNDVELRANVDKNKNLESGSIFVSGSLEEGGHFNFFLHQSGAIQGEIYSAQGFYSIESEGDNFSQVLIKEKNLSKLPSCGANHLDSRDDKESTHLHTHDDEEDTHPHTHHTIKTNQINRGGDLGRLQKTSSFNHQSIDPSNQTNTNNQRLLASKWNELHPLPDQELNQQTSSAIDILVVYTQRVEDFEGGLAQVQLRMEGEIAKTNQVLENSELPHRKVRLAGLHKVNYKQSEEGLVEDFYKLAYQRKDNTSNHDYSALDEVFEMVKEHNADVIVLAVRDPNQICGVARVGGFSSLAQKECQYSQDYSSCVSDKIKKEWLQDRFFVYSVQCINYTFTHELGHILGVVHNRESYPEEKLKKTKNIFTPYGFGYLDPNTTFDCKGQITIMSQGRASNCNSFDWLIRVPYFSNPNLFFPSPERSPYYYPYQSNIPMGVVGDWWAMDDQSPTNASRAINEAWDIVANLSDDLITNCDTSGATNPFCRQLASHPPDASSVDLSKLNHDTSFRLSSGVFYKFHQLENLILNKNQLSYLFSPIFHDLFLLKNIDLSSNRFQEIPSLAFSKLISVKNIDLSFNQIKTIHKDAFANNTELAHLYLNQNRISYIDSDVLLNLGQLEVLDMSRNKLRDLPNLSGLSKLNILSLDSNWLTGISRNMFVNLSSLKRLVLRKNHISKIDHFSFSDLSNLRFLDLYKNRIEVISRSTFQGLSKVTSLHLGRNKFTHLPDRVFEHIPNLRTLWLHRNQIQSIAPDAFDGLSKLKYLNLSFNPLTNPLPKKVCDFLDTVQQLHLNGIDKDVICP